MFDSVTSINNLHGILNSTLNVEISKNIGWGSQVGANISVSKTQFSAGVLFSDEIHKV